jgi:hypothetical protein
MKAAMRSVFFTLLLLTIIMYIFAIAFVQLAPEGGYIKSEYFEAVPSSMYTLLLYGVLLDNVGTLTKALGGEPVLLCLFLLFILIGALTVMNMLVGVLCEVVSAVASTEQEEMLVNYVNAKLTTVMTMLDSDGGGSISKVEFMQIIDNEEAVRCLADVGVDVFALIDLADYIFEDDEADNENEIELNFAHFMDVVLQLRGTNQATVKDIVDLRKFMRKSMSENYKQNQMIVDKLDGVSSLTVSMSKMASGGAWSSSPKSKSKDEKQTSFVPNGSLSECEEGQPKQELPSVLNGNTLEEPLKTTAVKFLDECSLNLHRLQGSSDAFAEFFHENQKTIADGSLLKEGGENFAVSQDFLPMLPPSTPCSQLLNASATGGSAESEDLLLLNNPWTPISDKGLQQLQHTFSTTSTSANTTSSTSPDNEMTPPLAPQSASHSNGGALPAQRQVNDSSVILPSRGDAQDIFPRHVNEQTAWANAHVKNYRL